MRTLNPDTVLRVFLCDFRKIELAGRIDEVGEEAATALSRETGGRENASQRVGAPNRVEGRLMLSSRNVGTSRQCEHPEKYGSDVMIAYLKRFHSTGLLPPARSLAPRTGLYRRPGPLLV